MGGGLTERKESDEERGVENGAECDRTHYIHR